MLTLNDVPIETVEYKYGIDWGDGEPIVEYDSLEDLYECAGRVPQGQFGIVMRYIYVGEWQPYREDS